MHHRAKFREDWSNRSGNMADFGFSRWRPSAILNFQKLIIFNFWSGSEVQYASSHKISRISVKPFQRYGRFSIFWRWRPSAILDLFYACWDHPRRVFGGLCDCAKFGYNRCRNFDSMQILIFCTLSLKMPIHAPKIGFFGVLPPKWGAIWTRPPKGTYLGGNTSYDISSKSVHVCGLGASRRIMQKTEKNFKKVYLIRNHNTFFTCSPDHPRCRSATWICMCGHTRDPVICSKFHRNPFKGVGAPGVKIWPFPLLWLVAFTTICTTVQDVVHSNPHVFALD